MAVALKRSKVSRKINTSILERQRGTDRQHNARKSRKTYRFSKDWQMHEAMTYFTLYSYNFCWIANPSRAHTRWRVAEADSRDGRWFDGSCLDT